MTRNRAVRRDVFTVAEANAMLPLVRAIASDLSLLARDVMDRRRRLSQLRSGRDRSDGDLYHEELLQVQDDLEKDARRVREYVEEMRALGVEPVDGPEGIVSFPSMLGDRRVTLCWKLGEPEVAYWYETNAGFHQRKRLPGASEATAVGSKV